MGDRILEELPGWSLAWSMSLTGPRGRRWTRPAGSRRSAATAGATKELQYHTDSSDNAALDGAGNLAITVRRTDPQGLRVGVGAEPHGQPLVTKPPHRLGRRRRRGLPHEPVRPRPRNTRPRPLKCHELCSPQRWPWRGVSGRYPGDRHSRVRGGGAGRVGGPGPNPSCRAGQRPGADRVAAERGAHLRLDKPRVLLRGRG